MQKEALSPLLSELHVVVVAKKGGREEGPRSFFVLVSSYFLST